jgi:hypothetical protein
VQSAAEESQESSSSMRCTVKANSFCSICLLTPDEFDGWLKATAPMKVTVY